MIGVVTEHRGTQGSNLADDEKHERRQQSIKTRFQYTCHRVYQSSGLTEPVRHQTDVSQAAAGDGPCRQPDMI